MNIEQVPIYDIKPYENNAKKHTEAQIEEIAKSIHDFGFNQNLVIDKNNVLVVGHGRWEAAKLLGLETVPCVRAENLTDEQIRLYRLVDNRVATTPRGVDKNNLICYNDMRISEERRSGKVHIFFICAVFCVEGAKMLQRLSNPWEGMDVSKWQGAIDFIQVKASGKKFVLIRAGYGRYKSQKDPYFEVNYKNAKAVGLYVGVYWYSYTAELDPKYCDVIVQPTLGKRNREQGGEDKWADRINIIPTLNRI